MKAVVLIEGRQAIPVRAIPFITGFDLPPDELAYLAAAPAVEVRAFDSGVVEVTNHRCISTFTLNENSEHRPIAPAEWEMVEIEIQCLSQKLKADENTEGENRAAWRRQAVTLLPAACFVWRDEFEDWYRRTRPITISRKYNRLPDDELFPLLENGSITAIENSIFLEYEPLIPEGLEDAVLEGFEPGACENHSAAIATAANISMTPSQDRAVDKNELIDGLHLYEPKWTDILKKPHREGKRYQAALVAKGCRGKGRGESTNSSLWNPIIFTRLAVECGDLNQRAAVARFNKAWPKWQDELAAEMGELPPL